LSRKGQRLLVRNQRTAANILRIENKLTKVGRWEDEVGQLLALTATHIGHSLAGGEEVLLEVAPRIREMASLGKTSAPDLRKTKVTLNPVLDKDSFSSAEQTDLSLLLLDHGIPFPEVPFAKKPTFANPLPITKWLEQVLVAEFAHCSDLLGRNSQGQLNTLQLPDYLLSADKREFFRNRGFFANAFPGLHTSRGIAELIDAYMQVVVSPLDLFLPKNIIRYYLEYRRRSGHPKDFWKYLRSLRANTIEYFEHFNFLDFAKPHLSTLFHLPNPHDHASTLFQLGNLKMVDWWIKGYMRGDRVQATYQSIQRILLLARLSNIYYRQIIEKSDLFYHTIKTGALITAGLYLEAYYAEQKMLESISIDMLKDFQKRAKEEREDLLHTHLHSSSFIFRIDLQTLFSNKKVPFSIEPDIEKGTFDPTHLIAWLGDNPLIRDLTATKQLEKIAATGNEVELGEWILEFLKQEAKLMTLRNPLLQFALAINNASSPADLEARIAALGTDAIEQLSMLPSDFPGRGQIKKHIQTITSFEEEGWSRPRSQEETEILRARILHEFEQDLEISKRETNVIRERQHFFTFDDIERINNQRLNRLAPLFHKIDS